MIRFRDFDISSVVDINKEKIISTVFFVPYHTIRIVAVANFANESCPPRITLSSVDLSNSKVV